MGEMELRYRGNVTKFGDGWGFIQSNNKDIGSVFVSGRDICSDGIKKLEVNDTVEFSLTKDEKDRFRAIDVDVINRNVVKHNTEDKFYWYTEGEKLEHAFVKEIVPKIGRALIINPEKESNPTVIDLYNPDMNYYADLKTQNTPFFTAFTYGYDPTYTVTFNRKDYLRYKTLYPSAIIYWYVNWQQVTLGKWEVDPLEGVWEVPFSDMAKVIEEGEAPLHAYQNRITDDANARDSYLFNLNDFVRLL